MSLSGKKARFEALRSRDSATFTGSYQTLGSSMAHDPVLLKVVNNSTVLVTLSYDGGVTDHDVLPANSFSLYDFGSDAQSTERDHRLSLPKGSQISVKGAAGTGSVYAMAVYAGD